MRAQTMVDVISIFVILTPCLLHHNNVGVTYARTSNFRMEPVRSIPLYFVVMHKFVITIIEAQICINTNTYCCWYKVQTTNSKGNKTCKCA